MNNTADLVAILDEDGESAGIILSPARWLKLLHNFNIEHGDNNEVSLSLNGKKNKELLISLIYNSIILTRERTIQAINSKKQHIHTSRSCEIISYR
jgi:hypothetical protein